MRLDCALICDAATVRDGLLHILGGGVTRVSRANFPGPAMVSVGLRVEMTIEEADSRHTAELELFGGEDAEPQARLSVEFSAVPDEFSVANNEPLYINLAFPTSVVSLSGPGAYRFDVVIDGERLGSLRFQATDLALSPPEVRRLD